MITPLIILSLLLLPLLAVRAIAGSEKQTVGGVLGMAFAFAFFGIGHFVQTEAMIKMMPSLVPFPRSLVLATGVLEMGVALALLYPATRKRAGLAAIAIFIAFFPVNVIAAFNHTGMGGHVWGPVYLLIRAPLQVLLIGWVWVFVLRLASKDRPMIKASTTHAH